MLRVQPDWETSFKVDLQPFWVNRFDVQGKLAREGQVTLFKDGDDVRCDAPAGFSITWASSEHRLNVEADGMRAQFFAAAQTWPISASLRGKNKLFSLGLSPEGGLGVSGGVDGQLRIWETQDGSIRRELEGHHGDINACLFFPSGEVVLSASSDRLLKIWSATEGYCAADLKGHALGVLGCDIIERGRNVVSCSRDGTAKLWDVSTQACFATWELSSTLNAVAVARAPEGIATTQVQPHANEVGTEGKLLLVAAEDAFLHAFDLRSRAAAFKCAAGAAVNCVRAANHTVTVGTEKGSVCSWDLRAHASPRYTIAPTSAPVTSLVLASENAGWAAAGDGSCWRWQETEGLAVNSFLSGPDCDRLNALAMYAHGSSTTLYTAGRDGMVRKYRVVL